MLIILDRDITEISNLNGPSLFLIADKMRSIVLRCDTMLVSKKELRYNVSSCFSVSAEQISIRFFLWAQKMISRVQ